MARRVTITYSAPGQSPDDIRRLLEDFDPEAGAPYKREGASGVWRSAFGRRDIVVKRWSRPGLLSAVKRAIGLSRAARHRAGAAALRAIGIRTPDILATAHDLGADGPGEWVVMGLARGRTLLDHLGARDLGVAGERDLARALGSMVRRMVDSGRFNRDHKPSNLVVSTSDSGGPTVTVLDPLGIGRCARGSDAGAAAMLASMVIEPIGCGCPPSAPARWRVVLEAAGGSRDRARRLWREVERAVRRHGDPVPRVDPRRGA